MMTEWAEDCCATIRGGLFRIIRPESWYLVWVRRCYNRAADLIAGMAIRAKARIAHAQLDWTPQAGSTLYGFSDGAKNGFGVAYGVVIMEVQRGKRPNPILCLGEKFGNDDAAPEAEFHGITKCQQLLHHIGSQHSLNLNNFTMLDASCHLRQLIQSKAEEGASGIL